MISALPLELISAMMNSIEMAVAPRKGEEELWEESKCATNAGRVRWDGRNGREREAMIHLVEEKREVVLLDFIAHKQRAKLRELFTNKRLGEEVSHVDVCANVKDTEQAVLNVMPDVVPPCFQSLSVAVSTWVVGGENCALVVTKNRRRQLRTNLLQIIEVAFLFLINCDDSSNMRNDKSDLDQ